MFEGQPKSKFRARKILRALLCCVALATTIQTVIAASYAGPTQAELKAYAATSDTVKSKLLIELAQTGDHDFAERLLQEFPLQGPLAKNRTLFIQGLILKAKGDFTGAAKNYRAVLANDPSLTLVRAELAKTLVALDQDDSAKHHLQLLAADAPDQQQVLAIKSFIDQVDAKRPFVMSGYISAAPSSNLNSASSHEKVYVAMNGQQVGFSTATKESGIGIAGGINAAYSKRLGNKLLGVLAGGVNAKIYKDDNFNQISLSETAELRYLTDTGYIGLGIVGSQSRGTTSFEPTTTSVGPRVSLSHNITAKDHLSANLSYEWDNHANDLLDGNTLSTELSLNHAIDSTFNVTLFGSFNSVTTKDASFGHDTWASGIGFYKEISAGITLDSQISYMRTNFDDLHSIVFPVLREDDRITTTVGITKRDFNILGLAPSINYTYSHNISNVDLYDFNSHALDFRLTKKF